MKNQHSITSDKQKIKRKVTRVSKLHQELLKKRE